MGESSVALNPGVEVVETADGIRLRGPAEPVVETLQRLRQLKDKPTGYTARIGSWRILVTSVVPDEVPKLTVAMPGDAWNIAASVLSDVAYGEYRNPFDFSEVGYLDPPPHPDFGVEITGDLLG